MSIVTMILGQSGTGKSSSLRNLDPSQTLLIQMINKPLPFRDKRWKPIKDGVGNIWVQSRWDMLIEGMQRSTKPIIVLDDFQYLLATEFMSRAYEKGYDKFTEMGRHYYDVLIAAANLEPHKRVYALSHTDTNESGHSKAKTIGKMLDEKITVEGLVTIVLRTQVINGQYVFSTRNSGSDTTKTPIGMFEQEHIENDLAMVDKAISDYYEITQAA